MIAKATANELGFPLFQLDVGSLFGKFIGQTEENFRKVIETMDGIGRCVLYIDEVEKSINRDAVSGAGDSGTSSRSFATLLTWLSDHETPVFLIATSNNHLRLPPEFLRKGRFDELWWLDLPTEVERQEIFSVLLTKNNRDTTKYDLKKLAKEATDLTGAEIENVIVSAMFDRFALDGKEITTTNLMDEINKTMPFAKTAAEDLAKMRETAKGKLRTATSSGIVKTLEANRTRSVDLANLSM